MVKRSAFSEYSAIDFIKKRFPQSGNILPLYDDAWGCLLKKKHLVFAGDMLVETTDVPPFMTIRQMGFKSFTISVSDIASKGLLPTYYYLIIGLPRGFGWRRFRELVAGWRQAVNLYGGTLMGGDTNESSCVTISVVALSLSNRLPIPRTGGKPGDIVAVTGTFGETYVGFKMMRSLDRLPESLRKRVLRKICRPVARLKEGVALNGVATACTDSSDGLAISLYNIIRGTGNGILVDRLPVSKGLEEASRILGASFYQMVFHGGEEFELVAVIPRGKWRKAVKRVERAGGSLIPIGRIVDRKGVWYRREDGKTVRVLRSGWEHLK
ncbi:MAG: thiamine-phosphate kinase [Candidatus Brockarchaeota archaeon]|nr:thiamine-phosphate kinase [Candidatus Brockarchaeota archaeon]MBO3809345.1 thiamine-phosphate kinase [Candidatus Brockarchaeota archaeon]